MKKGIYLLIFTLCLLTVGIIYSQGTDQPATQGDDKNRINTIIDDEAKTTKELLGENTSKALYKVMVDTFEEAGEWYAKMPSDQGIVISRRQVGAPKALSKEGPQGEVKTAPRGEQNPPEFRKEDGTYQDKYYLPAADNRKYVLGVRVDFQKRGNNWFAVYPYRPIRLEGVVKSFEVWVAGRQKTHKLFIIVEDVYGDEKLIPMGKLNFLGWKRMYVNVPDQITQFDYKITNRRGLVFKGFMVECSPLESWGKYYIYFDNLTAEVSRFWEEYQDQRDPMDTW